MADVTMPQLGETVTEGTVTRWLKQVGDPVAEDEVIFEVSTDKVDSEVPSPSSGYLSEILVPEGETVDVGTRLAVITAEAPAQGGPAPSPEPASTVEPAEARPPAPVEAEAELEPDLPPEREQQSRPAPVGPRASAPTPSGLAGATRPPDARPPSGPGGTGPGGTGPGGSGPSKVLSPVVRRLLAEHNLDPNQIRGSGQGGRITRDDVLALIDQQGTTAGNGETATSPPATPAAPPRAPAPAPPAPAPPAPAQPAATAGERDTIVPFTNIRRRTAEHMVRSKATSAHTVVAMEVDYSAVEKVRLANKERFKEVEGFGLTYLPFIARAVVDAIEVWPHINSSVGDDELIVHNYVNLGIAVDLNHEGLLVPVIHDADTKRLRAIAREISALASRARAKRLTMDDISGGTFTITNAGPFGTLFTIPVINQPQVAILATDGVRKRPVVVELPDGTDGIAVHPVGNLVLAFDHRAFDGAYASVFMGSLKEILETRDWPAEL